MARLVVKVDKVFVTELECREEISSTTISRRLKNEGKTSSLSISDFYPNLSEKGQVAHVNYVQDLPLMTQIPFFSKKVLVKIEPFRTPDHFKAQYGVSVETMVELIRRHLVIPIVSSDLHRYTNLHYLAPILSMPQIVVSSIRNKHFFLTLSPEYEEYVEERKDLFKQKFKQFSKEWQEKYRTGAEAFVTARAKRYARIKVMNPNLARFVEEELDQGPALVDMMDLIFIDPLTTSIEGTFTIDEALYRRIVQEVPLLSGEKSFEVFHSQIAEQILPYFGLMFPDQLTLSQLDEFQKSELPERCHEILVALNAAIDSKSTDVNNKAQELKECWEETTKCLKSILRKKKDWEYIIAGGSIIMVGAGAAVTTGKPTIGGLAATMATATNLFPFIAQIRSGLAEQIAKIRRPKLACIMFDFKKKVDELKRYE